MKSGLKIVVLAAAVVALALFGGRLWRAGKARAVTGEELFTLADKVLSFDAGFRVEALFAELSGYARYRFYSEPILEVFEGWHSWHPDERAARLAEILGDAAADPEASDICASFLDESLARYIPDNALVLAAAMERDARSAGFSGTEIHRFATALVVDPDLFFHEKLLPDPTGLGEMWGSRLRALFEGKQGFAVTIDDAQIKLGDQWVADLECYEERKECDGDALQRMTRCRDDTPGSEACHDAPIVGVEPLDKEPDAPESLVIVPLRLALDRKARRKFEFLETARRFSNSDFSVTVFMGPRVPYRTLTEVIFTAGRIGDSRIGGLCRFVLEDFPSSRRRIRTRKFTLPKYGAPARAGCTRNGPASVVLEISRGGFELQIQGGDHGHPERSTVPKRTRECVGPGGIRTNALYDYPALYALLLRELHSAGQARSDYLVIGAADRVPWQVVRRTIDTALSLRDAEVPDDWCEPRNHRSFGWGSRRDSEDTQPLFYRFIPVIL